MPSLCKATSSIISLALWIIILVAVPTRADEPADDFQFIRTGPGLSLHKDLFMLPATISGAYSGAQTEAVFQISAKHRILGLPLYFAYTQISFWQAYDARNSAPFRETNYNPEIFFRPKTFPFSSGQVSADIGFEHESNGQKPPISRSWNLLYFSPYYLRPNFLIYLKLRYRLSEDEKTNPLDAAGDDNPDITDYLGYSDLQLFYRFPWHHLVRLMLRGNLATGKGGFVACYSFPVEIGDLSYFYLRVSHGYGESLVDYKRSLTRVGFGIMFSR